jgi:hypothetical protein
MELLGYLLKVTICTGLFYGFYYLCLRHLTFHRWNRLYLLTTLLLSFILPNIEFEQQKVVEVTTINDSPLLPVATIATKVAAERLPVVAVAVTESFSKNTEAIQQDLIGLAIYGAGTTAVLLMLLLEIFKIVRLWRFSQQPPHREWVEVNGTFSAASFFGLIFLNTTHLKSSEIEQILAHERAHGYLGHSIDVLFAEITKVFLWFNPFIYWYKNALTQTHEYEVDALMSTQFEPKTYAHLMLKLATTKLSSGLIHPFGTHPISKRVHFLFQKPTKTMKKLLYPFALSLGVAGVLAFAPRKEVVEYRTKAETKATSKAKPLKDYPLKVHNKHVWYSFEKEKKPKPKYFSEHNLGLNDLCMLPSGGVYYLVNPLLLNLKDIAEVNRLTAKRWKVEIVVTEKVLDSEGRLSKVGLAVKNLKTNQITGHEVIDMAEARKIGQQYGYLDIEMRNPYWKPQITLDYGDKDLTVSKCSKVSKEHIVSVIMNETAVVKDSEDEVEYIVYPDKMNLASFQKASEYFQKQGFNLTFLDPKMDKKGQLLSFNISFKNTKNQEVKSLIIANDLRNYYVMSKPQFKERFDEPLTISGNKITKEITIKTTSEWTEQVRKKGHLKPFEAIQK